MRALTEKMLAITLIFVICASFAFGDNSNEAKSDPIKLSLGLESINPRNIAVEEQPIRIIIEPAQIKQSSIFDFIQKPDMNNKSSISGRNPAISRAPGGELMRGYESWNMGQSLSSWDVSLDNGTSWSEAVTFYNGGETYPAIDYYSDSILFLGTYVTPSSFLDGAGVVLLKFEDVSDTTTWSALWSDFSDNGWHNMISIDISADDSRQGWNWGIISLVMSYTGSSNSVVNAPHIYTQLTSMGHTQLSYYPNVVDCKTTAVDIDSIAGKTYSVYDRYSETKQQWELFVRNDYFYDWYLPITASTLRSSDSTMDMLYPSIAASADTVLIVCEFHDTDDPANNAIVCWGSHNGTVTGIELKSTVANIGPDEGKPSISHLEGNDFVCTFINNNQLFAAVTCDGGLSWSDAVLVNESVADDFASVDISEDGQRVIWETPDSGDTLLTLATLGNLDFDDDGYGLCDDNCPNNSNPGQTDSDGDGNGDACDLCPGHDDYADADGDGVPDGCDNCPGNANPAQDDADSDNIGDICDACTDTDGDGLGDPGYPANTCAEDNCPQIANPLQNDTDSDGIGNLCDNCPNNVNPAQDDADRDGFGDECDDCTDIDGDGYGDPGYANNTCPEDNCPTVYNPLQEDSDSDGIGDSCIYICGDANRDNNVNIGDAIHIINYVFKGGSSPAPLESGDANCDGNCNIGDAIYLINYVFKSGPSPCADCPQKAKVIIQ